MTQTLGQIEHAATAVKATRDLAGDSVVLLTILVIFLLSFVLLRWGVIPLARLILQIQREQTTQTTNLTKASEAHERAAIIQGETTKQMGSMIERIGAKLG